MTSIRGEKMDELIKALTKHLKEGTDTAEISKILAGKVVSEVKDKDGAAAFIKANPQLLSAYDAGITAAVQSHDTKFTAEKMPGLIEAERKKMRDELTKELNPKETPEQKQIRELQASIDTMTAKDKKTELKDLLRLKAKEIGYDVSTADRFAVYGDKAMETMEAEQKIFKASVDSQIEAEIKKRFGDTQPNKGKVIDTKTARDRLIAQYDEMEKSDNPDKGALMLGLKDQIIKLPKE